jgi:small subunit ribosomal protein S6
MPFYENVFIVRQDASTQQTEALAQQFTDLIKANGGEVVRNEMWGLRSLTYRIKKNRKGHYVLLNIAVPPGVTGAINELERNQRINEDVIRYLTVRVEKLEDGPSAMLQSRGRDERPRRDDDRPRRFDERPRRDDDRPRRDRDSPVAGVES